MNDLPFLDEPRPGRFEIRQAGKDHRELQLLGQKLLHARRSVNSSLAPAEK